jgi:hypothetical protein
MRIGTARDGLSLRLRTFPYYGPLLALALSPFIAYTTESFRLLVRTTSLTNFPAKTDGLILEGSLDDLH